MVDRLTDEHHAGPEVLAELCERVIKRHLRIGSPGPSKDAGARAGGDVVAREARDLRQRAINVGAFHDERQDRVARFIHRRDRAGRAIIVALACYLTFFVLKLFLHGSFAGCGAFDVV